MTLPHPNFANYVGQPIGVVEPALREKWQGTITVLQPGMVTDASVRPGRIKVFVDDAGLVTKIVNG